MVVEWEGKLALFESTKRPVCNDIIQEKQVSGVQLVWLTEKLPKFYGEIAFRLLRPSLDQEREKKLYEFIDFAMGKPYNDSKYVMVRGKQRRNLQSDHSSFFCSQLVAEALQKCGILEDADRGLASTNYSPADFSSEGSISLLENFSYSNELIFEQLNLSRELESVRI
jgi:hypothetical protein